MSASTTTRAPLVTGIDTGVGTTTLAAALHARDGGVLGQEADVVVCAATTESLRAAALVACPSRGPRPVLVVTGDPAAAPVPAAVRTRFCAVVQLPRVDGWTDPATAAADAAGVLAVPAEKLPAPLRDYAEALRTVVSTLLGAGLLDTGAPPMVIRPRGTQLSTPPRPLRPATPPADGVPPADFPPADERTGAARPRHRLPDSAPCEPAGRRALVEPRSPVPTAPLTPTPDPVPPAPSPDLPPPVTTTGRHVLTVPTADPAPDRTPRPPRTTRPPRRISDTRPAKARARRSAAVEDADDETIEARNLAADRSPGARRRAG